MSIRVTAGTTFVVAALLAGTATAASSLRLGPETHAQLGLYQGYYDGHRDGYVITDVSSTSQAAALHVNFAATIRNAKAAPPQYFVVGRAAPGQLAVFGSEPGEPDYNPLWDEIFVHWRAGVKPVLLTSDTQIEAMAKKHMLTTTNPHIDLNAPITSIGSRHTVT